MLFYIGQIFFALVIALSLQLIKIEGISCAERISRSIEKTTLGLYLNDVAHVGVFYLRKFTKRHEIGLESIKEYVPKNVKESMLRVKKLERMISGSKGETSDIVDPEKLIDQELVFDGIKKAVSGNKAAQDSKRDINSSASEK